MEITPRVMPPTAESAVRQYSRDSSSRSTGASSKGAVVDIQARQEPLGIALAGTLRALAEDAGFPHSAINHAMSAASGPENMAHKLSSIAAGLVSAERRLSDGDTKTLPQLFDTIRQSIDQGFSQAEQVASDSGKVQLYQARNMTEQQLQSLESLVGLRGENAA